MDKKSEAMYKQPEAGGKKSEAVNKQPETGDKKSEAMNKQPEAGDKKSETSGNTAHLRRNRANNTKSEKVKSQKRNKQQEVGDKKPEAFGNTARLNRDGARNTYHCKYLRTIACNTVPGQPATLYNKDGTRELLCLECMKREYPGNGWSTGTKSVSVIEWGKLNVPIIPTIYV